MSVGLIIQGPILSPGYGPYEFDKEGIYKKSWINFDSRANIKTLVEKAQNLFDYIVICTWVDKTKTYDISNIYSSELDKEHQLKGFQSKRKKAKIIYLELQENILLVENRQKSNHKYHQITLTGAGASMLMTLGCQTLAKIRTDQNLDIRLLHEEVVNHKKRNSKAIGSPYLNLFQLDRLTDFYFVGSTKVVKEVCDSYLNNSELFEDTHKDYFYQFLGTLLPKKKKSIKYHGIRNHVQNVASWTNIFYPLDRALYKNFYWRGQRVNYKLNGWVRWFFLFHSKSKYSLGYKCILNLFIIFWMQLYYRITKRIFSVYLYRKFSKLAKTN